MKYTIKIKAKPLIEEDYTYAVTARGFRATGSLCYYDDGQRNDVDGSRWFFMPQRSRAKMNEKTRRRTRVAEHAKDDVVEKLFTLILPQDPDYTELIRHIDL